MRIICEPYFREDGVQIVERETDDPEWDVKWQFKAWGREGNMRDVRTVKPDAEEHINRISYHYPDIEEWYVNEERGLEHGFTIAEPSTGDGPLVLRGVFGGCAKAHSGVIPSTIDFEDDDGDIVLNYTKLEVTDDTGTNLNATIRQLQDKVLLVVHDNEAVYPINLDPIYVPPPIGDWRAESDQAGAQMGCSVSGAGDVNGDGYADVIVGVSEFDNGQTNEGVAFIYLGSASGIAAHSTTEAVILESDQAGACMGSSVSNAGDVNGELL